MKIKLGKVYGSCKLELDIEAADLKKGLFEACIFTQKDQCFLCKSNEISLEGNKDKEGNLYIKRKCLNQKCGASSGLGSYKTGGFFWHQWEIYKANNQVSNDNDYLEST